MEMITHEVEIHSENEPNENKDKDHTMEEEVINQSFRKVYPAQIKRWQAYSKGFNF